MPHELQSIEDMTDDILGRTLVVFRKGGENSVKYKFRTKKTLFTIKVSQENTANVETRIESSGHPIEIVDV